MLHDSDIEPRIQREFGSRLEPLNFRTVGPHKWLRSLNNPIREIFTIGSLKGGQYSPKWGFSSGIVPWLHGQTFRKQGADKNSKMDLIIDPIDSAGDIPSQAFNCITGENPEILNQRIRACAQYFIPQAIADFARVNSLRDFCNLFLERSHLQYRRFPFDAYVTHRLTRGFVLILTGKRREGLERIHDFCQNMDLEFDNPVLTECIRKAETLEAAGGNNQ